MKILSTKILNAADEQAFLEASWIVDMCNVIDIVEIMDADTIREIQTASAQKANVIFTSQQSITIVQKILQEAIPKYWNIYCINGATQKAVENWIGESSIKASAKDAKNLVKLMGNMSRAIPTYFFCAAQRSPVLPTWMSENNISFVEYAMYNIVPVPVSVNELYDIYLFFSPSGVSAFLEKNTIPESALIITIGDTTKNYLQQLEYTTIFAAEQPTVASMIDKIQSLWK